MSTAKQSDSFQPTIVVSTKESAPEKSLDVSQAKIGFVKGTRPRFADQTTTLLRGRLEAATLVLSIILALAVIG